MHIKNKYLISFSIFVVLFFVSNFVYALELNYPRIPGAIPPQDFVKTAPTDEIPAYFIKYIFNFTIWASGIILLGALIYAGFQYLTSSGKPGKIISAKEQLTAVFFGLLILLSSYILLKTISPQFTNLKIPVLKPLEIIEQPKIQPVLSENINTSIEIEMPIGRIIESILEMYVSKVPEPKNEKPRITRIKENAEKIKEITDTLKKNSEALKDDADKCSCRQTDPVTACGNNSSGDTTWKCDCGGCSATEPCTCDPCSNVRTDIQNTEKSNLEQISNLKIEQIKTGEEMRLLREELDRLERGQKFINECPARSTLSLAQLFSKDDYFKTQKWQIEVKNFWDDVSIVYNRPVSAYGRWHPSVDPKKPTNDYATFYCSISGTLEQENPFPTPSLTGNESEEQDIESILSETMACSKEAPIGEIIDRTERVGRLLIVKFQEITDWGKKLTEAVDKLQVLISQCSSQRGCERRCTCFSCGCGTYPCIDKCEGWAYGCADSSLPYGSGPCKPRDEDTPCPYKEINDQLDEIKKIHQEIIDRIEGKGNKETPEEMGVLPLIGEVAPEIVKDLDTVARYTMKDYCQGQEDIALYKCGWSLGATDPSGKVIYKCCYTETWEGGERKDTSYGACYEECYLKIGITEHRKCVQDCLNRKGQELKDTELPLCANALNFYCCNNK